MSEMTITEKVAYLKGLMEGLDFQADTKEGKILKLMADILADMADELVGAQDELDDIHEFLDAVDEDLTTLEEELFGPFEEEGCGCGCEECDEECECFEVVCPSCGKTVCFEELPEEKTFPCPACNQEIPLD